MNASEQKAENNPGMLYKVVVIEKPIGNKNNNFLCGKIPARHRQASQSLKRYK